MSAAVNLSGMLCDGDIPGSGTAQRSKLCFQLTEIRSDFGTQCRDLRILALDPLGKFHAQPGNFTILLRTQG